MLFGLRRIAWEWLWPVAKEELQAWLNEQAVPRVIGHARKAAEETARSAARETASDWLNVHGRPQIADIAKGAAYSAVRHAVKVCDHCGKVLVIATESKWPEHQMPWAGTFDRVFAGSGLHAGPPGAAPSLYRCPKSGCALDERVTGNSSAADGP